MRTIIFFIIAVIPVVLSCKQEVDSIPIYKESFDSLPLKKEISYTDDSNKTERGNHSIETIKREKALASTLLPTMGYKAPHRAELTLDLEPSYSKEDEIWIGFNFMVPRSYELDSLNNKRGVMVFQIHSKPEVESSFWNNTWDDYRKNLPFNRPSISLHLKKEKDTYTLFLMYGLNGKPNTAFEDKKWTKVAAQKIEPDRWNSITINYKLGFDDNGYVAMWVNDTAYTSENYRQNRIFGPNMHNNAKPFLKLGLYRFWNDSHEHTVFYNNLVIAGEREEFIKHQYTLEP